MTTAPPSSQLRIGAGYRGILPDAGWVSGGTISLPCRAPAIEPIISLYASPALMDDEIESPPPAVVEAQEICLSCFPRRNLAAADVKYARAGGRRPPSLLHGKLGSPKAKRSLVSTPRSIGIWVSTAYSLPPALFIPRDKCQRESRLAAWCERRLPRTVFGVTASRRTCEASSRGTQTGTSMSR